MEGDLITPAPADVDLVGSTDSSEKSFSERSFEERPIPIPPPEIETPPIFPEIHIPEPNSFELDNPEPEISETPALKQHLCRPCSGICSCCFEGEHFGQQYGKTCGLCGSCVTCLLSPLIILALCSLVVTGAGCTVATCCCCCFCGGLAFTDKWREARFNNLLTCCMYTCCCFIPTSVYDQDT